MTERVAPRGRPCTPGRGRGLLVGLCACLVAGSTGCTGTAGDGSTVQPAPAAPRTGTSAPDLKSSLDLRDEHQVEWSRAEQVGSSQIRVHFVLGDPRCFGARSVVRATREAIEITVLEGSLPDAPDRCTLVAAEVSLLVTSDAPVGGRRIVRP